MPSIKPQYQKIVLDPVFPVEAISMHSTVGRDLVYCHWHPNIEVIHVTKGRILLYIDNEPYELTCGDICIVNPNRVHYGNALEGYESSIDLVVLSYDILPFDHKDPYYQKYIASLQSGDLILPTVIPTCPKEDKKDTASPIEQCRELLIKLIHYGRHIFNGREIAIQGAFLELIATMHHHQLLVKSEQIQKNRRGSRNMAMLDYVEGHFTEQLTVPEMAEHFGVNEDYFYRLFKSYTGQTPITFIHQLRIRYAKQLLRNTDMSISEISYQVGFSSPSYFTKVFGKHAQLSPKAYRKQYNSRS